MQLRLGDGEQLDVIGMVKRGWNPGGQRISYPSVERVAADPWLRKNAEHLGPIRQACDALPRESLPQIDAEYRQYGDFPYDGTAIYSSRYREFQEAGLTEAELKPLARAVAEITKECGEPSPYLAVLAADGDRIGKALSGLNSPEAHREFSRKLAQFASEAKEIVERNHGVAVFTGGDDVLAFVPIDSCLGCARNLHERFAEIGNTTLSVGLAIAHFMEPLEDLLDYARAAERHAKGPDRDGLAIHLHKRGGAPVKYRARWQAGPVAHFEKLINSATARELPGLLPYHLHEIARVYEGWPPASAAHALQADTISILKGKKTRGGNAMSEISRQIEAIEDAHGLRELANQLLIARHLSGATQ